MAAPPTPHARPPWRTRGRAMFTERLGLKGTALAIAVLLWFVIGARQPTESYVTVSVMPLLDSTRVLLGDPPHLRALVAGRAADIVKLHTVPPVMRWVIGRDAPDTLVMDLVPGDVHIPVDMARDVRVLDLEPRRVTLRFAPRPSLRAECPGSMNCGGR